MFENPYQQTVKPTALSALVPFFSHPVTLTVFGLGATAYLAYRLLKNDAEEENGLSTVPSGSEPVNEPLRNVYVERSESFNPTAHEPLHIHYIEDEKLDEEDEKEQIRKAMSILGKRSGRVRGKK
ncbi:MAG: hypothetical protein OXR68_01875 [Alphaproteobacteria bacterium]|nr:hypothetical protein [Alphaproteobacteria bacterium]MDD9919359.1 hypothetical protein [Alphaproteobacteria bacterium]